ncbi:hypothetical protein HBB16_11415 [Pseudonocardia sp. MCCB 268]|nr:hypothetical protein [Pseudonocardia cytotoxica]
MTAAGRLTRREMRRGQAGSGRGLCLVAPPGRVRPARGGLILLGSGGEVFYRAPEPGRTDARSRC